MNVTDAVQRRIAVRAFKPDPVPGEVVREILQKAAKAPSGGNLQPWRVYALGGQELQDLKDQMRGRPADPPEYAVYPPDLWDPFRTRRYANGEDLYATIGIPRDDKPARMAQISRNGEFFGAPVGLFFFIDRKLGPPQWADLGMYMQTVMLLAVEKGLDTIAQEYWARYSKAIPEFLGAPEDHMLFAGMGLGYRDEDHPINTLKSRRDPFDDWGHLRGF